jgi:alkaline phosphatase
MKRMTKLRIVTLLVAAIFALGSYLFFPWSDLGNTAQPQSPKYIFIFLADGAGVAHLETTRMYNRVVHNEGLTITDKIIKEGSLGLMTTHPADSLSTDSAAAATAMASGCKAKVGSIGSCADGTMPKTVLEVAKEKGLRVGLVTNSTIYDASPAAFAGHVPDRKLYGTIIDQYLKLEPDLLLGGGRDYFLPKSQTGSKRKDESDLIASFKNRGYAYAADKRDLAAAKGPKVLGLFSLQEMSFDLDRDKDKEPSVSEMTQAAIRILEAGNQRGFLAFIENENTDGASHLTDVASVIHAFRDFDRAVGFAYEFYRKHPRETLILVTSDHDTGGPGFTLALEDASGRDAKRMIATEKDLKKIHSIPISLKKAADILGRNPTSESIDELMQNYFKGFTLAPDLKKMLLAKQLPGRNIYTDAVANSLGMMVANNTQVYWHSTGHTNQPVFVAALGVGAEKFRGYQDNTDFGKHLRALLGEKDSGYSGTNPGKPSNL